jgi:hypothetical protein
VPRLEALLSGFFLLALLLLGGSPGSAQTPPPDAEAGVPDAPPADSILRGVLRLGGEPADSGTVVLHRVTPAEAGPVDSIRVDTDGAFAFPLPGPPIPGSGEIYFASARHAGILYFGPPITDPVQLQSSYLIETHRTSAAPPGGIPFTVSVRNLFIDEGPLGWRVTDVFEIRNEDSVTWIAEPEDEPVWSYPLPRGARSFRVGQSDLPEDAVRFAEGSVFVHAPVPPGERLYVIQYEVESIEFAIPLPGITELVEVLVEEPAPELVMEGLTPAPPLQLEPEMVYLRWLGEGFADTEVTIGRGREGGTDPLPWLGMGLALLLLVLAVWLVRRPTFERSGVGRPAAGTHARSGRAEVLLRVARLDEEFDALEAPGPEEEARYLARREALIARLPEGDGPPESEGR